jgi:predicted nucleotidyltransferase
VDNIKFVLNKIKQSLQGVRGIQAIVLGGSRARGTNTDDSDIDIGLYYDAVALNLVELEKCACGLDDKHRNNLIAKPGEWGA